MQNRYVYGYYTEINSVTINYWLDFIISVTMSVKLGGNLEIFYTEWCTIYVYNAYNVICTNSNIWHYKYHICDIMSFSQKTMPT